ncbi:hypothetical protein P8452_44475 [Trifolium repens]|nr:hypothetical protein P8452_44475 [Trifolium repens]
MQPTSNSQHFPTSCYCTLNPLPARKWIEDDFCHGHRRLNRTNYQRESPEKEEFTSTEYSATRFDTNKEHTT